MKTIAIIGGGASGVAAALKIKQINENYRVILLEKNDRILKKLLVTGNGKCNITNRDVTPAYYHNPLAKHIVQQYDFQIVRSFLASCGILIKSDAAGRCYPLSESAANAVNLLRAALKKSGVEVRTEFEVKNIRQADGKYSVIGREKIQADAVIFAIGSAAGIKGYNGYDILHNAGIPFNKPAPALCPIPSDEPFLKQLKGVRAKAGITLGDKTEIGEIQFTEKEISGICAFNLSRYVQDGDTVYLNFNSENLSKKQLEDMLCENCKTLSECGGLLDFLLLRKLAFVLLKAAGIRPSDNPQTVTEQQRAKLIELIHHFPVRVNKPKEFLRAQTVCGGLGQAQADSTLHSNQYKGLFFAGEILDADAPCGGFNLHWAWASGLCAAENVIKFLEKTID